MVFTLSGFSQKEGYAEIYYMNKSETSKAIKSPTSINADDVYKMGAMIHLHPQSYKDLDKINFIVSRGENGTEGIYSASGDQFRNYKNKSDEHEGYVVIYPKIVDYKKNPSDGKGEFYHSLYNKHFNGNYFLSKKGIDYSTREEVNEYDLHLKVVGYKIEKYNQVLENGVIKNVPVYGNPITLAPSRKVKIITSPDIKPMPKSSSVGDVNELEGIGDAFNNAASKNRGDVKGAENKEEKVSESFEDDKKAICDCFKDSFEGKTKRWKCFLEQNKTSLKYKGDERKKFISETNPCADKEE